MTNPHEQAEDRIERLERQAAARGRGLKGARVEVYMTAELAHRPSTSWRRVLMVVPVLALLFTAMLGALTAAIQWPLLMAPAILLVAGLTWCTVRICRTWR